MNEINDDVKDIRKPLYDIDPIFVNRWSKRVVSSEELTDEELMPLFEAAKWAPSAFNDQFWRFIIGRGENKQKFIDLLVEGNKAWAGKAPVLSVVIAKQNFDRNGRPARTHQFDTGAAWMSLALEGTRRGLVVHPMAGFSYKKAKEVLNIPDEYSILAMIAIGKPGNPDDFPSSILDNEKPSLRKPISEIIFEGEFGRKKSD